MAAVIGASAPVRSRPSLFDRAPQRTDDSSKGYAVGAGRIWNHRGEIYVPKDVTAGQASWVKYPVQPRTCLLDVVGGASVAYGVTKLLSSYAGPAFRVVRASDGTTLDIGFLSDNSLDTASLAKFIAGTTGKIDILYSHYGNGLDATQTVDANRLPVSTRRIGKHLALTFPGDGIIGASMTYFFNLPAGLSVDKRAVSTAIVARPISADGSWAYYEFGTAGGLSLYVTFSNLASYSSFGTRSFAPTQTSNVIVQSIYSATGASVVQNGVATAGLVEAAGTLTGGRLGGSQSAPYFPGRFDLGAFVVWPRALTSTEQDAVNAILASQFDICPQHDVNLVYEGDSGHHGRGVLDLRNAHDMVDRLLGDPSIRKVNLGISGYKLAQMNSTYATRVGAAFEPGKLNLLLILGGANDIAGDSTTGAQTYARLATLVASARATGYQRIAVCTLFPSSTFYGATSADPKWQARTDYNALIRANSIGADTVVDYASHPVVGPHPSAGADTTLFYDNVHRTAIAHEMSAAMDAAFVRQFWPVNNGWS